MLIPSSLFDPALQFLIVQLRTRVQFSTAIMSVSPRPFTAHTREKMPVTDTGTITLFPVWREVIDSQNNLGPLRKKGNYLRESSNLDM